MPVNRLSTHGVIASIVAIAGVSWACSQKVERSPTEPALPVFGLAVRSVVPSVGSAGTVISVYGQGFETGTTVTMNGVSAESVFISSYALTAVVPILAAGLVDVVVTNPRSQSARLPAVFTYVPMTVTSVSPISGLPGDRVRIYGTGFSDNRLPGAPTLTVTIDGVASPFWIRFEDGYCPQDKARTGTDRCIETVAPEHGAGPVDVVVSQNGQSAALTAGYTYLTATVSAGSNFVTPGGQLTVSWTQPPSATFMIGGKTVGLFSTGADVPVWTVYTGGFNSVPASGTRTLTAPSQPGQYEFRYYGTFSDQFDRDFTFFIARSGMVTVSAAESELARAPRQFGLPTPERPGSMRVR